MRPRFQDLEPYGEWKGRLEQLVGYRIEKPIDLEYIMPLHGTGISPHGAYGWWKLTGREAKERI